MLSLPDRWVWDFWLVRSGDDHHIFYLQAPKSIGDPELRHWNASIGHAVSGDLTDWTILDDALWPRDKPGWDDFTTWTGSVIAHDGRWHLMYTGTSRADEGRVQRVGLAVSDDLIEWRRSPRPPVEAGPPYEKLEAESWHDEAWRDPWVFRDPGNGRFHAYLTARVAEGDAFDRGVVGHLRSVDLESWEVMAPVTPRLGLGQLEVPQLIRLGERWYLVYCSDVETQSPGWRDGGAGTGTYYLVGASPFGPFRRVGDGVLAADRRGSTYAGKLHHTTAGELVFLAWNRSGPAGEFVGTIADPRRVEVGAGGQLNVSPVRP